MKLSKRQYFKIMIQESLGKAEVAPPGREAQVKRLKKIYGDEDIAYRVAWASYKKSKLGAAQDKPLKGGTTRKKAGSLKKVAKDVGKAVKKKFGRK